MGARYEVTQIYHAEADYEALGRLLHDYREDTSAFLSYERVWLGLLHDVDGKTLKNLTSGDPVQPARSRVPSGSPRAFRQRRRQYRRRWGGRSRSLRLYRP